MQSGDESYDKMTRGYMDAWEEMKNDATYTKEQLAEKCEDFSRLLWVLNIQIFISVWLFMKRLMLANHSG